MNDEHAIPSWIPSRRSASVPCSPTSGTRSGRRVDAARRSRPGSTRPSPVSWPTERDEPATPAPSNVVPLRRRWAPRAAAAAAAVIVVGAGGVAAANLGVFRLVDTTTTADKASSGSGGGQAESLDSGATRTAAPASEPGSVAGRPGRSPAPRVGGLVRLRRRSPGAGARRPSGTRRPPSASPRTTRPPGRSRPPAPGRRSATRSTTTPVLYDGTRAVLVVHPAQGGRATRRGVDLHRTTTCSTAARVAACPAPSGQSSPGGPRIRQPQPDAVRLAPWPTPTGTAPARTRSVSCEVTLDVRQQAELVWSVAVADGPELAAEDLHGHRRRRRDARSRSSGSTTAAGCTCARRRPARCG